MKTLYFVFIFISLPFYLLSQTNIDSLNVYEFHYNGNKYQIIKEVMTWRDAALFADEQGGILAEINSQEEQDTIYYHSQNADINIYATKAPDGGNASYLWLGGNDINEEGVWVWDGNFDGIGAQFWEGTVSGAPIDSLFNNWGNEPDNFSNQDALGLALTRWPRGDSSQWNDVNANNELYFIIEYNNSTFRLNKVEYDYVEKNIVLFPKFEFNYDSVGLNINDKVHEIYYNVSPEDTILISNFEVNISQIIKVRLFAYRDEKSTNSRKFEIEILSFKNPIINYATDFENIPLHDFVGNDFTIEKVFPFRNIAIHSPHNYKISSDITYVFAKPIIIQELNAKIIYSEVVSVEPGDSGSIFGEESFKDYVIVEGAKEVDKWMPLINGYDSRFHPDWLDYWNNGGLLRKYSKKHEINLSNVLSPGDTILIRFRLHSDAEVNGWGWIIDSLEIQDFPLNLTDKTMLPISIQLMQNYPNPFNPNTIIKYSLPLADKKNRSVTLKVYDVLGREIVTLVNKLQYPGSFEVEFDASSLSNGIYYYQLRTGNLTKTRKMVLLK